MNEFTTTDVGEIPRTWQVRKLGEVFETQLGKMLSQKAHGGEFPMPYLRNKNVQWGKVNTSDILAMDFSDREKEKFRLRAGDLLICEGGVPGRAAIWNGIIDECYYQKALHRLRPRNGSITNEFMLRWLQFAFDLKNLYGVAGGSSTISHLPESQLKSLPIPVPPLSEQRKIAEVLGLVQRPIEQQERLIENTAELKRTLFHQLLTHGLRNESQKQSDIGPVPESWDVVPLIDAVDRIDYGISAPIPKTPPPNGVKIVSTADITKDGRLLYEKIRRIEAPPKTIIRLTLEDGDVLFNWRNSAELIGKTAVFQSQSERHVFASFILRIVCGETRSHNRYLAYLMNHWRVESVFLKLARRAVNQANYNRNEISILKIPLPSHEEQREIAGMIGAVDSKIELHRRKHATLTALFRTLLDQLMTARIRVHELDLPELETAGANG